MPVPWPMPWLFLASTKASVIPVIVTFKVPGLFIERLTEVVALAVIVMLELGVNGPEFGINPSTV